MRWLPQNVSDGRLHLDLFHIGNPQTTVRTKQQRYRVIDASGVPIEPNASYSQSLLFQPPMSARLGLQLNF